MQIFKKTLISTVLFSVCFISFSMVFLHISGLSLQKHLIYSDEIELSIPEETNYLFCGTSQCAMSIIPDIIDEQLNVKSYNVSVQALKLRGRYELLKNITRSHAIDTVVLEISLDSFTWNEDDLNEGDYNMLWYFGNYIKPSYILRHPYSIFSTQFNKLQKFYNDYMHSGFDQILAILRSNDSKKEEFQYWDNKELNRGYEEYSCNSVELSEDEAIATMNSATLSKTYRNENVKLLKKCIALCKEQDIEVIIIVVPVSGTYIWQSNAEEGFDYFYEYLNDFCDANDCTLFDFNLLRDRHQNYSDSSAFYNTNHMGYTGAQQLSNDFCDIVSAHASGEDIGTFFYETYQKMMNDSPYMTYIE